MTGTIGKSSVQAAKRPIVANVSRFGLTLFGFSSFAAAQTGSIVFVPASSGPGMPAEAIPALSSVATVLLVLAIAAVAVLSTRSRGRLFSLLAGLVVAGLVLVLGKPIVGIAQSDPSVFSIMNSAGETLPINGGVTNDYTNMSGASLQIDSAIMPAVCSPGISPILGSCQIGQTLEDGGSCSVFCGGGNASDRRLKQDIELVGETHNGLPLYRFRYIGGDVLYEGVMAQDVKALYPHAVVTRADGYMAVRYEAIGLEMRRVGD